MHSVTTTRTLDQQHGGALIELGLVIAISAVFLITVTLLMIDYRKSTQLAYQFQEDMATVNQIMKGVARAASYAPDSGPAHTGDITDLDSKYPQYCVPYDPHDLKGIDIVNIEYTGPASKTERSVIITLHAHLDASLNAKRKVYYRHVMRTDSGFTGSNDKFTITRRYLYPTYSNNNITMVTDFTYYIHQDSSTQFDPASGVYPCH